MPWIGQPEHRNSKHRRTTIRRKLESISELKRDRRERSPAARHRNTPSQNLSDSQSLWKSSPSILRTLKPMWAALCSLTRDGRLRSYRNRWKCSDASVFQRNAPHKRRLRNWFAGTVRGENPFFYFSRILFVAAKVSAPNMPRLSFSIALDFQSKSIMSFIYNWDFSRAARYFSIKL